MPAGGLTARSAPRAARRRTLRTAPQDAFRRACPRDRLVGSDPELDGVGGQDRPSKRSRCASPVRGRPHPEQALARVSHPAAGQTLRRGAPRGDARSTWRAIDGTRGSRRTASLRSDSDHDAPFAAHDRAECAMSSRPLLLHTFVVRADAERSVGFESHMFGTDASRPPPRAPNHRAFLCDCEAHVDGERARADARSGHPRRSP